MLICASTAWNYCKHHGGTRDWTLCFRHTASSSFLDIRMPPSSSTSSARTPVTHPWCDICWATPSWKGLHFQRCVTCQVGVHVECYGISGYEFSSTDLSPDFQCWACQAVGTTVKVRERDGAAGKRRLRFKERPTECCLCSVDDGTEWYHAMHPIYDRHGIYGRQMVLPPTKDHPQQRLAWGHTLCCFALYTHVRTAGCVYACDARGAYDGTEDDTTSLDDDEYDDGSTTSSANSDLVGTPGPNDLSIHHFGYWLPNRDGTDDAWTKVIREHQTELKCYICGRTDKFASSFRIPIQCSANDPDEFEGLQGCHKTDRPCLIATHVGCARWGGRHHETFGERSNVRRVWFFPGKVDADGNISVAPVSNLFCQAHAEENSHSGVPGALTVRCPDDIRPIQAPPPPVDPPSSSISGVATQKRTSINNAPVGEGKSATAIGGSEAQSQLSTIQASVPHKDIINRTTTTTMKPRTLMGGFINDAPGRDGQSASTGTIVGTEAQNQVATIQASAGSASSATANSVVRAQKHIATTKTAAGVPGASAASTTWDVRIPKKKRWTCHSPRYGRAADVRSRPGLRESGEAYSLTAAAGTKRKVGPSASVLLPPEQLSPTPLTFVTNERKDSIRDKLVRKAYKGIREEEESGKHHLDDILAISAARWKEKLDFPPTEFQDFWELVVAMVSTKLDFSTEKSDWSFLTADYNSDLKRQYARTWATVKLLHLGHVPDDLNDT